MRKKTLLCAIVSAIILFLFSCAPKHDLVGHHNTVPVDPGVHYGLLPNGFQYILVKNLTPQDRVNVHLNIFAGSMQEADDQQGLAHFLEHMLFNGSEHFQPGQLIEYFQKIGMDFGADANAHTSFFNTTYDLSLPKGDRQHLNDAFIVIQDYAKGALLIPDEIDRERGIILAEKRERDSISYRTFKKTIAFELPGSRYARRMPIGVEEILKNAGRKQLKAYYDHWYRPDNMALIVVGDFDIQAAQKMIQERFSNLKPRTILSGKSTDNQWKPHQGIKTFYHYEPEAGSTDVTIETMSWTPFKAQSLESLKRQTIENISNLMLQNRLSRMITKQSAQFSQGSVYSGTYLRHLSLSAISATCKPEQWKATLGQIETVLHQALKFGFSPKELDRVKADYKSMLEAQFKQAATQKTSAVAKKILSGINGKKLLLSPEQKMNLLTPFIETISIADTHLALKKAWSPDHRLILVSGNANIKEKSPRKIILNQYLASSKKEVHPYKDFQSKPFPYLDVPAQKAKIIREQQIDGLNIKQLQFSNNTALNLKKTDFKKNQFLFKISFGHGKASEPGSKPGLAYLSERVIQHSGFGGLDMDQLEEALAGKNVAFNFKIHENYFSFSGSSDPKDAELVFQLIYHFLEDPGVRAEALQLAKTRYRQEYDQLKRTTDGVMLIHGNSFLAGNDSRFSLPEPAVMASYTVNDIKNWLMVYLKQYPIELSVAGDVNETLIKDLASTYLGSLSQRRSLDSIKMKPLTLIFPTGKKERYTIDTKIDKGVVRLGFLTDDFWDIKQTRRLSMLSRVISERLRIIIREELGASYSPYAYNAPSLIFQDYGILHIVVQVKPDTQDFVYSKIKEIISDIRTNGITQKELQLVLKPVLNHIKVLRSTNRYWLNSVLANGFVYPQKFKWALDMEDDYNSITSHELEQLAGRYLTIDNSAVIFISSEN